MPGQNPANASGSAATLLGDAISQAYPFDASRTNILLRSFDLSNAAWTQSGGITVPVTNGADPRGGTTFCTLSDLVGTLGELSQNVAIANDNTAYVFSAWFRAGTSVQSRIGLDLTGGAAVNASVDFNPQNGVQISNVGTTQISIFVLGGVTYYRVSVYAQNNTSGNVVAKSYIRPASATAGANGTVLTGLCQLETAPTAGSATPSPYIPTVDATGNAPAGVIPAFALQARVETQVFTANGNSTAPVWATKALLIGTAGGAGGGGGAGVVSTAGAGGGGAGQSTSGTTVNVVGGTTYAVGIGTAGAGSTGNGVAGTAGGNTTFGALLTLVGGNPGANSNGGAPGAGGTAGVAGQGDGSPGYTTDGYGGRGGGFGAAEAFAGVNGNNAAANSGGGGSGGGGGITAVRGGNGGSGRLVVIYYA